MHKLITVVVCLLVSTFMVMSKTVYDTEYGSITELINSNGKAKYVIRYQHQFRDTLRLPYGSELKFQGGSLNGPLIFDYTKLSGRVNLKGASISGTIKNKTFDASWLCAMDGETDDAASINEMIAVCDYIYFPQGRYNLVSVFNPKGRVPEGYESSIRAHVGVAKSNLFLEGEDGAVFTIDDALSGICIFSQPYQIENSIRNISIKNLIFETRNNGIDFHELIHTIKTIGVNNLIIEGCTFNDFWGDAISLSHYGDTPSTGERTRNQNVKIINNFILGGDHHNNRNGISVINGKNVIIKGNTIRNTSREDMPGGIDIEPNNSAYTIDNINIENNILEGCEGTVGAIGVVMLRDNAPGNNIKISGNTIRGCSNGIAIVIKTKGTTSGFVIKNNFVASDTRPYKFIYSGESKDWVIENNVFEKSCNQKIPGNIQVKNLMIDGKKKE